MYVDNFRSNFIFEDGEFMVSESLKNFISAIIAALSKKIMF